MRTEEQAIGGRDRRRSRPIVWLCRRPVGQALAERLYLPAAEGRFQSMG
jgi:hypothetical protein